MSLPKAYGSALQALRLRLGLSQKDLAKGVSQHYVSDLEAGRKAASLSLTMDLVTELGAHPATFFALLLAAAEESSPRAILQEALGELERLELADVVLPAAPSDLPHPRTVTANEKLEKVAALKKAGLYQAEIAAKLGLPKTTVNRLWNRA